MTKLLKVLLLTLMMVAGLCAFAQQDRPAAQQPPDTMSQQTQTMSQMADQQVFTGKVAEAGSKYVLKDTATRATYMLDDQDRAKQFEGKEVKVNGTLDPQTKTIQVASIAPQS